MDNIHNAQRTDRELKYYKVQEVASPEDLVALNEVLDQIVGKTCWRADIVNNLLNLDIGEMVPYDDDSLQKGRFHGEWELSIIYSGWEIVQHSMILMASSSDYVTDEGVPEEVLKKVKAIEGSQIAGYQVDYTDLSLELAFTGGYKLMVYPGMNGNQSDAFWELFTPSHMVLDAGPGETYFYTCSLLPGMDPWEMLEFEELLETARRNGNGGTLTPDGDFTIEELVAKGEEFRDLYPYKSPLDEESDS